MSSQSTSVNFQAVIDSIFGCCIGTRRSRNYEQGRRSGAEENDERTPLLGGGQGSSSGRIAGVGHKAGQDSIAGQGGDQNRISQSNNVTDQRDVQATGQAKGNERKKALGIISQRNREVDLARLRSIRNNANCAFFNVESSQLLPSSSSTLLSQRMTNMGSSHRKFNQTKGATDAENLDENGLANYTSQQRKELIIASDKAERLYKAALKTSSKDPITIPSTADEAVDGSLTVSNDVTKSEETQTVEESHQETAPIGLVRQIRLSVRDVGNSNNDQVSGVKIEESNSKEFEQRLSSKNSKRSPDRPVFTLRNSSESLSNDDTLTRLTSTSGAMRAGRSNTIASVHSLRTLRLGPAISSQISLTDAGLSTDSDLGLFGKSQQSNATTTNDGSSIDKQTPTDDEETWERRGRTRSRRGLVWMDTTTVNSNNSAKNKSKLEEMWNEEEEGENATDLTKSELTQKTVQQSHQTILPSDEVQYGLRFEVKQSKEKREEMTERLKKAITQPMADMWEDHSNNT